MNVYYKISDELFANENVDYTFMGRDDTFLIYVFLKNSEVCPLQVLHEIKLLGNKFTLEVLHEINLLASKFNLSGFWMKRSLNIPKNEEEYKHIYVFRAIDICEYVAKLA